MTTVKAKGHIARLTAACMIATALFGGAASAESITVTAERLNMRKEADASSKSMGLVMENETLSFISEIDDWYRVTDGDKTGYVMKEYVSLDKAQLQADVEANTKAYTASAEAKERVNMRALPMTDADIVKVVGKGDDVQITGQCGDWYRVNYRGRTGYIMAQYLTIGGSEGAAESAPADTSKEVVYAEAKTGETNARVNMRKSPSTEADVEKVVGEGGEVSVLGENGGWYKVSAGGRTGYIMKSYVELTAAGGSSENEETLYAGAVNAETTERVNLRKSASTGSSVVKVVGEGAEVSVLGESGGWYKVEFSGREGYILKDYIRMTGGTDNEDEPVDAVVPDGFVSYPAARTGATTERVNMRAAASSGADVEKVLNKNTSLTVLGEQGDFYQVKYGSALGYVAKEYVALGATGDSGASDEKTESSVDETLYSSARTMVTTVRVNMRKTPEGDVLHTLAADTEVTVIGEAGSWYKAVYSSSTGYISKAYLAERAVITVPSEPEQDEDEKTEISGDGTTAYITGESVNMRKGAGTGYGVVKVLRRGDEISFYSLTDGWYLIKAGDDAGYISEKYVSTTKPETAPANPSEDDEEVSAGKVQMADWWTSNIQSVFKRGVIATVTDVDTGISWKVLRSGGTNHADVQPLTAADTAKMKQAYGGKWSWNRRAIWVTIDGVSYAASMNGMPHGTGSIQDNNFDGHHCIHFLNSRTHTGNRWDTAHQAAVQKAYKAGQ